jgi:hypothetical protein
VERVAFAPLRRRGAEPLLALITSLGAGVVLVNLLQILMGAEGYAFPQETGTLAGLPEVLMIGGARIRSDPAAAAAGLQRGRGGPQPLAGAQPWRPGPARRGRRRHHSPAAGDQQRRDGAPRPSFSAEPWRASAAA